jgi:hypothetical protein
MPSRPHHFFSVVFTPKKMTLPQPTLKKKKYATTRYFHHHTATTQTHQKIFCLSIGETDVIIELRTGPTGMVSDSGYGL